MLDGLQCEGQRHAWLITWTKHFFFFFLYLEVEVEKEINLCSWMAAWYVLQKLRNIHFRITNLCFMTPTIQTKAKCNICWGNWTFWQKCQTVKIYFSSMKMLFYFLTSSVELFCWSGWFHLWKPHLWPKKKKIKSSY